MYNRLFQLWYYTVSLRQMLLRSTGSKDVCNLDIYFAGVSYVELPTVIDGIEVLETTEQDVEYIMQKTGHADKIITVLRSGDYKYYVVSSHIKIFENNLDFFELPFTITGDMGDVYKSERRTIMLEQMYEKLDTFRGVTPEKKDVSILKQKEKEYGITMPESLYDFYRHYGNDKEFLSAFYNFDGVEDICIEHDALVFGYTHQKISRLGITLENLNSEYQSITWYSEELEGWYAERAVFPESFFFNMAAWHVLNLLPAIAKVRVSSAQFIKLMNTHFSYFNNDKIYVKGYRIIAVYHADILGCYWREDEELYLAAQEDSGLEKLEDELGLDLDWCS